MVVDWGLEALRLARLARLELGAAEALALAAECEAITREFGALSDYAAGLPAPPEAEPAPAREDVVAPASAAEVEGILRAAPHSDPKTRAVIVPRGLP